MLNTLSQTKTPDWNYGAMTFRSSQVNIIYVEEGEYEDEHYDIIYEQIEDQEASRSSCMAAQPR